MTETAHDREANPAFFFHRLGSAHTDCWCSTCEEEAKDKLWLAGDMEFWQRISRFMHLCPDCGNKRCPRAAHHDRECTNSNEPGQPGSDY